MYLGWTQVAFDADLTGDVVPVDVAGRALVAVRSADGFHVYDGRCPHRGAHLGYGGRLAGSVLVCPFHGHRVRLCAESDVARRSLPFRVASYESIHASGGLFVLLDRSHDTGLGPRLSAIAKSHHVRPAFERAISVPPEYVIENVLDADHFAAVHGLDRRPRLDVAEQPTGSLRVDGQLDMVRPNKWQVEESPDAAAQARVSAEVFSPTLVVTELGSGDPNVVITAATPTADGGCIARVTVALPRQSAARRPTVRELSSLVSGSRMAFDQDAMIWDHLDTTVIPHYVEGDKPVRAYRDFCLRFLAPGVAE